MPMPIKLTSTPLDGVFLVESRVIADNRGYFTEIYSSMMWEEAGINVNFVQDNVSQSSRGVLRGMHYQLNPQAQGKLVRCLKGAIFDVAVDLRKSSPDFGRWFGHELSEQNGTAMWVPEGFAHGFIALNDACVLYKCTSHHAPEYERSLSYKCPETNIQWPIEATIISPKDIDAPVLNAAEHNFI